MKRGIIFGVLFLILFSSIITSQEIINDISKDISKTKETVSQNQINLPENIKEFGAFLFKTEKESLTTGRFIIFVCLFLFILLVIQSISSMFGFLSPGIDWIFSLVLTLLMSISGGLNIGPIIWETIGDFTKIPEKFGPFWTGLGIILLVVIYILINYLARTLKESSKIAKAKTEGMKIGAGEAISKMKSKLKSLFIA